MSDPIIEPGGDPDAGIPADQAEIHGVDRAPPPLEEPERFPVVTDSLDNIDEDPATPEAPNNEKDSGTDVPPPDST